MLTRTERITGRSTNTAPIAACKSKGENIRRKGGESLKQKSEAQIFMEQPEKIEAIIENKLIEKKQWYDLALGITANMGGERVQSSGTKSRMGDAVEKCIDVEAEIDEQIDRLIAVRKSVIEVIEQLDSPMEYKVLHEKYIQYMDYHEIAAKHGKDYSWCTTVHGRALKNVQAILDERKKHDS